MSENADQRRRRLVEVLRAGHGGETATQSPDAFIFLLAARLVFGRLASTRDTAVVRTLGELVDPVHHAVARKLAMWRQEPVPDWMAWLVLVVLLIGTRHVLVFFVNNVF